MKIWFLISKILKFCIAQKKKTIIIIILFNIVGNLLGPKAYCDIHVTGQNNQEECHRKFLYLITFDPTKLCIQI